ncbi:hypothetical protein BCR34DRAFT_599496 [Clohesyomyces aquaticus]|uniref:Uncharacterized protein n=1 Tax=Clohesyomyces aquaticus TaxID=1231657 RepID=A0A1Y1ZVK6_9PLEO|nr:hypothetical protein BCR34DRAFT_599496 [Clohesyomyces aquaticus]
MSPERNRVDFNANNLRRPTAEELSLGRECIICQDTYDNEHHTPVIIDGERQNSVTEQEILIQQRQEAVRVQWNTPEQQQVNTRTKRELNDRILDNRAIRLQWQEEGLKRREVKFLVDPGKWEVGVGEFRKELEKEKAGLAKEKQDFAREKQQLASGKANLMKEMQILKEIKAAKAKKAN